MRTLAAVVVVAWCLPSLAHAAVINVPADQPTIQDAIDVAENGDVVIVQPGTYMEAICNWEHPP